MPCGTLPFCFLRRCGGRGTIEGGQERRCAPSGTIEGGQERRCAPSGASFGRICLLFAIGALAAELINILCSLRNITRLARFILISL